MSSAEEKSDVQVTHPGHIFPFGACAAGSPLPQLTQCCRFSIPERLPLQPFRQDRLSRLPLPPSLMESTSKTVSLTGAGVSYLSREQRSDVDPVKKVQQLEKNITFLQDTHAAMLKGLHQEISELKQKNRELHFHLITGYPALPPESSDKKHDDVHPKTQEKIEKLEKEIKKLRIALKDALKSNSLITNELQGMKRERHNVSSNATSSVKNAKDSGSGLPRDRTAHGPSPEMEQYSETLQQIQQATDSNTLKPGEGLPNEHSGNKFWDKGGNGHLENRRSRNYHRLTQQSQNAEYQQQHKLPRLPLRHQLQNYIPHNQYEMPYRHQSSSTLPLLKPHNEHANRQRKTRGPQPAKVDHVYNH